MRKWLAGAAAALAGAVVAGTAGPAMAADSLATWFPHTVATATITPDKAAVVRFDGARLQVPVKTFAEPVTLAVEQGPLSAFRVPKGTRAVFDFALAVKTAKGAAAPFLKPVMFTWVNAAVTKAAVYNNVTPAGAVVPNPTGLKIAGHTLSHPIKTDAVGWVITVPAKTKSAALTKATAVVDAKAKTKSKEHGKTKKTAKRHTGTKHTKTSSKKHAKAKSHAAKSKKK
jgi:hypothetical protein